ncbi:40S ribosomal protein S6 [Rhodotorula toruloides]
MRIASLEERLMQGENEDFEDIKNEFEMYRYLQEEKKGKGEVYPVCVGWFQAQSNVGGWVVTLWKNTGKGAWGLLAELRSLNPLGVLKRLHKLGVVHGKLSPSNILISKDIVRPLFCDFKRATILNKVSEKEAEDLKKKDEDDLKRFAHSLAKAPKTQRLVTPERLQRRRHLRSLKRRKTEQQREQIEEYKAVVAKRLAERQSFAKAVKVDRTCAR